MSEKAKGTLKIIFSFVLSIGVLFGLLSLVGWGQWLFLAAFTFGLPLILVLPLFICPFFTVFLKTIKGEGKRVLIIAVNFINLIIIAFHFKDYRMDMITEAGVDKIEINPAVKWIALISALLLIVITIYSLSKINLPEQKSQVKYQLRYFIEWGGISFWGMNDVAKEKYGYPIAIEQLPLSINLKRELYELEKEFQTALDWENPTEPSPWNETQKTSFRNRAISAWEAVKFELGNEYEVSYQVKIPK